MDPSANIIINGDHLDNRTNEDVQAIEILNSTTPFMIPQLFEAFPNIYELDIRSSNLQSINIPENIQLLWLFLYFNKIQRLEAGSATGLANQRRLTFIDMVSNGVQEIDEDAFNGLENMLVLILQGNDVREIQPRTFQTMANLEYLDLSFNELSSIGELFTTNPLLSSLYLEFNNIESISPRFITNSGDNLEYVNLSGNRCINRFFPLNEDFDWISMNNRLRTCFENFIGDVPDMKKVVFKFVGNIVISDEWGNIIARI